MLTSSSASKGQSSCGWMSGCRSILSTCDIWYKLLLLLLLKGIGNQSSRNLPNSARVRAVSGRDRVSEWPWSAKKPCPTMIASDVGRSHIASGGPLAQSSPVEVTAITTGQIDALRRWCRPSASLRLIPGFTRPGSSRPSRCLEAD